VIGPRCRTGAGPLHCDRRALAVKRQGLRFRRHLAIRNSAPQLICISCQNDKNTPFFTESACFCIARNQVSIKNINKNNKLLVITKFNDKYNK
jgi:hypothetical protein